MEEKKRTIILAAIAGAVGGGLGSVSGSNSWVVVAIVSAVFAILTAWGINNLVK